MKTTVLKTAFPIILSVALVILSLVGFSLGSNKMHWSFTSDNEEHVDVTINASNRGHIEIVASSEGGTCVLSCPNYKQVSFRERNIKSNSYTNSHCQFQAEITSPGVVTINFDKMPMDSQDIKTYFMINGENGADINATVVKVTRKLEGKKLIPVSHSNMASID